MKRDRAGISCNDKLWKTLSHILVGPNIYLYIRVVAALYLDLRLQCRRPHFFFVMLPNLQSIERLHETAMFKVFIKELLPDSY